MLKIDKKTLNEYKNAWINQVFVSFYDAWCSGTKIKLEDNIPENAVKINSEDLNIYCLEEHKKYLIWGKITKLWNKFFLDSKEVSDRCWCGSSFSLYKKLIDKDKIKKLKHKFKWISPKNMIIKTSEIDGEIEINQTGAIIIDDSNNDVSIILKENAEAKIFWLITEWKKDINISLKKCSKALVNYIVCPKESEVKTSITSDLTESHSESEMNIVTIAENSFLASIDWIINIPAWVEKVKWHLKQENLLLAEKTKVRWIPRLMVSSNDIEASHACKVEKIDENKLFYLTSRWIPKQVAEKMVKESYINKIFSQLPKTLFKNLKEKALK